MAKIIKYTSVKLTEDNLQDRAYFYGTLHDTVVTTTLSVLSQQGHVKTFSNKSQYKIIWFVLLLYLKNKCEVILSYRSLGWGGREH